MGGIGKLMPWTRWAFLVGALALVGIPPFAGFFSKDAIIAAALHDHWYGVVLCVAGLAGAFLTGLYTFRLYFIVFPGEPPAFATRAPPRARRQGGPARRCSSPVGRPRRARGDRRLDPVRAASGIRSRTGSRPSRARSRRRADEHAGGDRLRRRGRRSASPASASPGRCTEAERVAVPACPRSSARSSTSSTSTSSTTRSSTSPPPPSPARSGATSRSRSCSPPGSTSARARSSSAAARGRAADRARAHVRLLPRRRHGRPRRRLPAGQMTTSWLTTVLIWLPIAGALAIWLLPLSRYATGSLAVLVSLVEVGIWIEQAARFDFGEQRAPVRAADAPWIKDLHVSYHVGEYGFSLWLVGLDRGRDGGVHRLRLLGRPRPARARTSG